MLIPRQSIQIILAGSLSFLPIHASIRVIDETAIPYTSFLRKAEFDSRFPGESLTNTQNLDSGWYVFYSQESLQYLFGPISLQSTGRDYLEQLKGTVQEAVQQRPEIADHTLRLIKTPIDLDELKKPSEVNPKEKSEEAPEQKQLEPDSGFWGMIKRWFGF